MSEFLIDLLRMVVSGAVEREAFQSLAK